MMTSLIRLSYLHISCIFYHFTLITHRELFITQLNRYAVYCPNGSICWPFEELHSD